jgi:hypothetical protein
MLSITNKAGVLAIAAAFLLVFASSLSAHESAKKIISFPECVTVNNQPKDSNLNCRNWLLSAMLEVGKKRPNAEIAGFVKEVEALRKIETAFKEGQEERRERIYEVPIDPKRLFVIPIADVLGSLEINFGGSSAFGVRKTETRPFWGHMSLGLGNVAEVELSTLGVINRLAEGSASIPTAAFKLKFLSEGKIRPAVAGALVSSLWHTEERNDVKFQKRLSTLYFVASKSFGDTSFHAGISVNDLRIRTRTVDDVPLSPTQLEIDQTGKDYFNKNIVGPFIGLKVKLNPKTLLMFELEQIAEYIFDEDDPVVAQGDISTEWMTITGVRFFFFNWLALDAGVMYRSDYHGIGDAQIAAGLNINLPLPKLFRSIKENS